LAEWGQKIRMIGNEVSKVCPPLKVGLFTKLAILISLVRLSTVFGIRRIPLAKIVFLRISFLQPCN